ncbi:gag-pol polyprotein [Cucumis melo var. makuwa]|uniref:Gag-pol polyprotein n=1 Tax=Cucumis melo var. makuwa TaxID=1194695 RepID=A0A5D3DUX6_CUCMM|nr:gag-pol polyprotein [Cucumis melo var. makuwa]TYK27298.1 gag-pol polyprotein [Cucumis melo var. makuwa]
MIWRVKTSKKCKVAFTTVQTPVDAWYFDSGCSRHMTGNRSFFTELEECASSHVTFGDGAKGRIFAKGNIDKNKVIRNEAVVGIPSLDINDKFFCGDCQVGKQTKTSLRRLKECYTIRVLELLHLDLMQTESLGGKKYVLVVVDDYSRFTWGQKIIRIRSDPGKEFDNEDLNNFCQSEGIHHEFAALGKKPNVKYFHIFGSTCYILADRDYHRKWDVKSDQGIFLGYSQNSRAYRVFNIKSGTVMETINVVVNDFESNANQFNIEDDETSIIPDVTSTLLKEIPKDNYQSDSTKTNSEKITDEVMNDETVLVPSAHVKKNHPPSSIIGDPSAGITTRRKEKVDYTKMIADLCYVSTIEPTSVENALNDEYWRTTMQEELLQFKRNNVWTMVPKPDGVNVTGTKWIFKNKTDESGNITKNKARLVAQGYA